MIDVEKNYKIHDAEHLAIVESFCHWRHYLAQLCNTLEVLTNHCNLRVFMSMDKLTRRQVRLALNLSAFDFWLVYCKSILNPTDGPSRRLDQQRDDELEDSMTDNTLAFQRMLFPIVTSLSPKPMSSRKRKLDNFQFLILLIHDLSIKGDKQARLSQTKASM